MNHRRIRGIFTALAALAVLGFVAATSAPAQALVCRYYRACPVW